MIPPSINSHYSDVDREKLKGLTRNFCEMQSPKWRYILAPPHFLDFPNTLAVLLSCGTVIWIPHGFFTLDIVVKMLKDRGVSWIADEEIYSQGPGWYKGDDQDAYRNNGFYVEAQEPFDLVAAHKALNLIESHKE